MSLPESGGGGLKRSGLLRAIGKLDLFPVVQDKDAHLTQATKEGGIISTICAIVITILVVNETWSFFSPDLRSGLAIAKGDVETERVEFNISFTKAGCGKVLFEAFDQQSGQPNSKVQRTIQMEKKRLLSGTTTQIGEYIDGVSPNVAGEGCQVHGNFYITRVPSNFYIGPKGNAPGDSHGDHNIHQLRFGEPPKKYRYHRTSDSVVQKKLFGTLDGEVRRAKHAHMIYQYYIQVIPTYFKKGHAVDEVQYQYVVQESFLEAPDMAPGMYFRCGHSSVAVEYWYAYTTWSHFLVHICAIVGGVFTVTGFFVPATEVVKMWARKYQETTSLAAGSAPSSPK